MRCSLDPRTRLLDHAGPPGAMDSWSPWSSPCQLTPRILRGPPGPSDARDGRRYHPGPARPREVPRKPSETPLEGRVRRRTAYSNRRAAGRYANIRTKGLAEGNRLRHDYPCRAARPRCRLSSDRAMASRQCLRCRSRALDRSSRARPSTPRIPPARSITNSATAFPSARARASRV